MDFSVRSTEKERMDSFDMPQNELDRNLLELEIINRWLGGYAVSFSGLARLKPDRGRKWSVADLGCGGGDGMVAMSEYLSRKGVQARFTGIDANPAALLYARSRCKAYPGFEWKTIPFQEFDGSTTDILHCSLFAHHFFGEDLQRLVQVLGSARKGFIVNDLHRHPLAYYSIRLLTRLFSRSPLVRHDAPLSVARGFSRSELEEIFRPLALKFDLELRWQWAFRWRLTGIRRENA